MNKLILILISTLLVSLFSFIGVIILIIKKRVIKKITLILVSLSAGTLMGGAFLHLIPEASNSMKLDLVSFFVLGGFIIFFILEKILHWRHCHEVDCKIHSFAKMNLIGDGIHNFIDGLIIASSFIIDYSLGIITTIAIMVHEIPQEIGDFGVLIHGGFKIKKALFFNFISALIAVLGGLIGYFIFSYINLNYSILLCIAAGGFIYIAASDLIPEIRKEISIKKSLINFLIFLIGIVLMIILKFAGIA